jgi:hypothetical protein
MIYHVEVHPVRVSEYLRNLEGCTRLGRLALYGFMDALRIYGDEARAGCPRRTPDSTIFCLRWTFDSGSDVISVDFFVDDSQAAAGHLEVLYAELVPPLS